MEGDFYLKLTLAVYKVTELFPEGEVLKTQIRELADKILINLICNENSSRYIRMIKECFDLAEAQGWVDSRNFLALVREYDKIAGLINAGKPVENSSSNIVIIRDKAKKRQQEILDMVKENKKVKIGDLMRFFPDLNRRTLLRHLDILNRAGLVDRAGNGRGVCYGVRNATFSKMSNSLEKMSNF